MLWQLLKNGKQIIARAEPKEQGKLALFIMKVNPGEDLFGIPYQQLFDAAPRGLQSVRIPGKH